MTGNGANLAISSHVPKQTLSTPWHKGFQGSGHGCSISQNEITQRPISSTGWGVHSALPPREAPLHLLRKHLHSFLLELGLMLAKAEGWFGSPQPHLSLQLLHYFASWGIHGCRVTSTTLPSMSPVTQSNILCYRYPLWSRNDNTYLIGKAQWLTEPTYMTCLVYYLEHRISNKNNSFYLQSIYFALGSAYVNRPNPQNHPMR